MMNTSHQKDTGIAQQTDLQLKELLLQELKSLKQRMILNPVRVA